MITPVAALSSANRRRPSGRGPLPPRRGGVDPNIHAADTGKNDNQLTRKHKGKKLSAISCLEAIGENQIQHLPKFTDESPQFPCLRRVPFDTTKRNQKSPLGAGPSICTARITSRVAPDLLPCQPRRNIGPRRWTETHALLRESSRKAFRAYLHWFSVCEEQSPKTGWQCDTDWRCQFTDLTTRLFDRPVALDSSGLTGPKGTKSRR